MSRGLDGTISLAASGGFGRNALVAARDVDFLRHNELARQGICHKAKRYGTLVIQVTASKNLKLPGIQSKSLQTLQTRCDGCIGHKLRESKFVVVSVLFVIGSDGGIASGIQDAFDDFLGFLDLSPELIFIEPVIIERERENEWRMR